MGASTMLGVTMQESGVSKIIQIRLDEDTDKIPSYDEQDDFIDEDVSPEKDVVIPPRPPKRIHNPDGTVTDPVIIQHAKEVKEQKRLEREKAKAEKEAEKNAAEEKNMRQDSSEDNAKKNDE